MTKKRETRERKVFKEIASTGKYLNTGKVLIGLTRSYRLPTLSQDEERIQAALLGISKLPMGGGVVAYIVLLLAVFAGIIAVCIP